MTILRKINNIKQFIRKFGCLRTNHPLRYRGPQGKAQDGRRSGVSRQNATFNTYDLTPEETHKLQMLCEVRGESPNDIMRKFGIEGVRKAPRRISKHIHALKQVRFSSAGVRDGLAFVTLPNGRIFYGYTSKPNHRRAYEYVKDIIPDILSEDTFLMGLDIAQRYAIDFKWLPAILRPPKGGTIIECGAYLGHKTVRFVDELVGCNGKVLAIEMMPDNAEILRRNIHENGLTDVIDIMESGVWNEANTLLVKGKGRQRNSLLTIDQLVDSTTILARVDTLDALIQEWGRDDIHLLFITINGAEVEALHGMNASLDRVKTMFIAAPYQRDGRISGEICKEIAKQKGCRILEESNHTRIFIATPAMERAHCV